MLPEAKQYLRNAGWSHQPAGFLMMSCFVAGFFGIQILSRALHRYVPSHVVDCDHSHAGGHGHGHGIHDHHSHAASSRHSSTTRHLTHSHHTEHNHLANETTPLITSVDSNLSRPGELPRRVTTAHRGRGRTRVTVEDLRRRPSMLEVQKRVMSFVKDTKQNCDEQGSCYGYSDPCGQECFKHVAQRSASAGRLPTVLRTNVFVPVHEMDEHYSEAGDTPVSPRYRTSRATSRDPLHTGEPSDDEGEEMESCDGDEDLEAQHHHHVPTNAFLSIGLQTSIAIALHKFPEGFITYATNHVNPDLGFNVFMALFVHNITEGFAMALPLYMALGSRWSAMAWTALLGGLSQPFGAGMAVLWFKLANKTNFQPNEVAYACLFAATSGIMVSVALQLFVESLSFNHNRNLCIFFAFLGMAILGFSNALVSTH